MSKPEQIVKIEPQNELKFRGPFNAVVTSYMKLTNPTLFRIAYKIKTTAPKKYCVRPNAGILEPKDIEEVQICLQPPFVPAEKNKHKFMVQTMILPEGERSDDIFWKKATPEKLMDSKLKCVFEFPTSEGGVGSEDVTALAHDNTIEEEDRQPVTAVKVERNESVLKSNTEIEEYQRIENELRMENIKLKEQLLQLQKSSGQTKYTAQVVHDSSNQPNQLVLAAVGAIVVAILGFLLGKFV